MCTTISHCRRWWLAGIFVRAKTIQHLIGELIDRVYSVLTECRRDVINHCRRWQGRFRPFSLIRSTSFRSPIDAIRLHNTTSIVLDHGFLKHRRWQYYYWEKKHRCFTTERKMFRNWPAMCRAWWVVRYKERILRENRFTKKELKTKRGRRNKTSISIIGQEQKYLKYTRVTSTMRHGESMQKWLRPGVHEKRSRNWLRVLFAPAVTREGHMSCNRIVCLLQIVQEAHILT